MRTFEGAPVDRVSAVGRLVATVAVVLALAAGGCESRTPPDGAAPRPAPFGRLQSALTSEDGGAPGAAVGDCDPAAAAEMTDPENCGRCGKRCPVGASCVPGATCVCPPLEVVCENACTDLQSDPSHCGRCDGACGPEESCRRGQCGLP